MLIFRFRPKGFLPFDFPAILSYQHEVENKFRLKNTALSSFPYYQIINNQKAYTR